MVAGFQRRKDIAMATQMLDAKGLNCPMPIIKTKKMLKDLKAGETLEIFATDPGSVPDFNAFCRSTGNEMIEQSQDGSVFRFVIRRAA
jgi:tRNA 2-thiouridine synthesizing protein A